MNKPKGVPTNAPLVSAENVAAVEDEVQYVTITIPIATRPSGHPSDRCDIAQYMMRKHRLVDTFHHVKEGFRMDLATRNDGRPVESNSAAVIRIMELVAIELRKNGLSV